MARSHIPGNEVLKCQYDVDGIFTPIKALKCQAETKLNVVDRHILSAPFTLQ